MNINNKPFRYIEILVHIMVWTLLFCSPFLFMPSEREYDWFRFYQRFCISQIIVITIFYSNYSILINKYLFTKKFGRFFTINVFAIIIGSIIMFVVDDHFIPFDHIKPPRDTPREPPFKFGWVI